MAKQTINVGVTPNDGTGSTIRVGGQVINNNFDDIYNLFGDGSTINFDIGSPTNGQAIVYNSSTGNWEPGTSLVNSDFIVAGDSGADQTISSNDTLTIAGGTGIETVASLTDTLTISIDSSVVTPSSTHTFTNKTFDANGTGNSITNIEVADLASGVLDTDLSSVAGTDTTLASAKAIKTYVDSQVTAIDVDIAADTGTIAITDAETLTFTGGTGIDTSATGNAVTFNISNGGVDTTQLADSAVTNAKLANSSISISDSSSSSTSIPLGGGFSVLGGTGISSVVNGSELTLNLSGIDATSIADGSVSNTEFQHLGSVTSDIQTQLDNNRKRALAYAIIF